MHKELKIIIIIVAAIVLVAGTLFSFDRESSLTGSTVIDTVDDTPAPAVPVIPRDPLPADAQSFTSQDTLFLDGYEIKVYNSEIRNRVGEGGSLPADGQYILLYLKVTNVNNRESYFPQNFLFLYSNDDIKYTVDTEATNVYGFGGLYNPVLRKGQEKILKAVFDVPPEGSYAIRFYPAEGPVYYSPLAF